MIFSFPFITYTTLFHLEEKNCEELSRKNFVISAMAGNQAHGKNPRIFDHVLHVRLNELVKVKNRTTREGGSDNLLKTFFSKFYWLIQRPKDALLGWLLGSINATAPKFILFFHLLRRLFEKIMQQHQRMINKESKTRSIEKNGIFGKN